MDGRDFYCSTSIAFQSYRERETDDVGFQVQPSKVGRSIEFDIIFHRNQPEGKVVWF
ncbi:Hypothetical predicted protein [Podarcis lilfordi]|uniref:Uncharacterized protein n=1 Tax=Podarcis lilfordi TaxID=74358 RepID=A0AA35KEI1_9SAUR|nr:Hypothetical predicted protein [Podarcis lilfordi]